MKKIGFIVAILATFVVMNVLPAGAAPGTIEDSCAASLVSSIQSLAVQDANGCGSGNYRIQIGPCVQVNNWFEAWFYYPAYGIHTVERCWP